MAKNSPRPGQKRSKPRKGTSNNGGKREGAGRKPLDFSNEALSDLVKAVRDREEEEGQTAADKFSELLFDKDKALRLRAFKIYSDATSSKVIIPEGGEKPHLLLPDKKPIGDKADVVPIKK